MSFLVQGEFIVSYIFRVEIILCLIRRNISPDTVYIVFLLRRNIILKVFIHTLSVIVKIFTGCLMAEKYFQATHADVSFFVSRLGHKFNLD